MSKFKIGDKARVIRRNGSDFDGVKIGDIGKVVEVCENDVYQVYLRINKHDIYGFKENELGLIEENKMEKTFREVIADIKEGEVWESENNSCDIRIEKGQTGISIRDFKGNALVWFSDRFKFKLQRKEYTFQEAFAAYEEGKEIESILTGDKFLKSKRADGSDFDSFWDKGIKSWWRFLYFELELIRGKWYIND